MFGHANISLFCSVPMKKLEELSPESKRVLLIKGTECDGKVTAHTLKLAALSDPCYCVPEPARCYCKLEPAASGTGVWWEV